MASPSNELGTSQSPETDVFHSTTHKLGTGIGTELSDEDTPLITRDLSNLGGWGDGGGEGGEGERE